MKKKNKSKEHFAKLSNEILNHFDFEKVQKAMCALDWKWLSSDSTPTLEELKETATYLMNEAYKENTKISTGGFTASYKKENLELCFHVCQWNTLY